MTFKKGAEWNGNRLGPPRKPEIDQLREALEQAQKKNKKSLLQHAVSRAYEDDGVLCAILKKILPDLSSAKNEDIHRVVVEMRRIIKDGKELEYNVGS